MVVTPVAIFSLFILNSSIGNSTYAVQGGGTFRPPPSSTNTGGNNSDPGKTNPAVQQNNNTLPNFPAQTNGSGGAASSPLPDRFSPQVLNNRQQLPPSNTILNQTPNALPSGTLPSDTLPSDTLPSSNFSNDVLPARSIGDGSAPPPIANPNSILLNKNGLRNDQQTGGQSTAQIDSNNRSTNGNTQSPSTQNQMTPGAPIRLGFDDTTALPQNSGVNNSIGDPPNYQGRPNSFSQQTTSRQQSPQAGSGSNQFSDNSSPNFNSQNYSSSGNSEYYNPSNRGQGNNSSFQEQRKASQNRIPDYSRTQGQVPGSERGNISGQAGQFQQNLQTQNSLTPKYDPRVSSMTPSNVTAINSLAPNMGTPNMGTPNGNSPSVSNPVIGRLSEPKFESPNQPIVSAIPIEGNSNSRIQTVSAISDAQPANDNPPRTGSSSPLAQRFLDKIDISKTAGAVAGEPISMVKLMNAVAPNTRFVAAKAYWQCFADYAALRYCQDEKALLQRLGAPRSAHEQSMLKTALSLADSRVKQAEMQLQSSQRQLGRYIRTQHPDILPMAQDLPLIGTYSTRYEEIAATRSLPGIARQIHLSLPQQKQLVDSNAQLIAQSEQAFSQSIQAFQNNQAPFSSVLESLRLIRESHLQFVDSVHKYNLDTATYAFNVSSPYQAGRTVAAMLIPVKDLNSDKSPQNSQERVASNSQIMSTNGGYPTGLPARRSQVVEQVNPNQWRNQPASGTPVRQGQIPPGQFTPGQIRR